MHPQRAIFQADPSRTSQTQPPSGSPLGRHWSKTRRLRLLWLGLAVGALTCLAGVPAAGQTSVVDTLPPEPVLLPKIHGMELENGAYEYTDSYLPLMTATRDYRLGVSRKTQTIGGVREVRFFLLKPEDLDEQAGLTGSPRGAAHWIDVFDMHADNLLSNNPQFAADADDFHSHGDPDFDTMHFAVCDSTDGYANGKNPYACGPNLDCYEFDLMLGLVINHTSANPNPSGADEAQLFSTRVLVKIQDPKSKDAAIQSVEIVDKNGNGNRGDETLAGPRFVGETGQGIGSFHTPMIVGDQNQLLFARIGGNSVPKYTDENGVLRTSGKHDMVYAVNTTGNQCDLNGWNELRPISFATLDAAVAEFGFAQNTFRTPSGHEIQPHQRIYGTYLWVDQDADNLFFGSLKRPLLSSDVDPSKPLYDYVCWTGNDCHTGERTSNFHGWMMAGLWTHGKMVLLDSLVNNMDFGIRAAEKFHTSVQLYSDRSVRIGTGEEASKIDGGSEPLGYARTTVQFGSTEHFLNMARAMRPRTPRDVVWHITAGARSDELAFDDLISHRTLIFSPMNALKEMDPDGDRTYYDGNQWVEEGQPRPMRLQNAATGKDLLIPPYGEVTAQAQEGRIENVALGGIKARGFHLYSPSRIAYSIPSQNLSGKDWMISLFLDRRDTSTGSSRLITLPSGASISLDQGNSDLKICGSSGPCDSIVLPIAVPTKAWTHLALVIDDGTGTGSADKVQIYQNGFLFAEIDRPVGFDVEAGNLEVGKPSGASEAGFEGWIDELKVVEGPFNPEEICNHARGTLVAMPQSYLSDPTHPFTQLEAPFHARDPMPAHWISGREAVQDALHNSGAVAQFLSDYFVCHVDYTSHLGVSVDETGDPLVRPLRRRLLFPEGPVVFDQPRPMSADNNFCQSCHHSSSALGLHSDALIADPAEAQDDPRRMPMQSPRDLTGWLPEDYFGPNRPEVATSYSDLQPLVSDRWTLDGPIFRWKFDSGAGASQHNWVGGYMQSGHTGDATATIGTARKAGVGRAHSLEFNGGYLQVNSSSGQEPDIHGDQLTLATWMQLDDPAQPPSAHLQCLPFSSGVPCTVIAKSGPGSHDITWGLRLVYKNAGWWVQMHITGADGQIAHRTQALGAGFNPSAWHHLAAVYNDGAVEFLLDGTSLGPSAPIAVTDTALYTDPSHPISIGAKLKNGTTPTFPFHGRLDELHVYDRALADWEVALLVVDTP